MIVFEWPKDRTKNFVKRLVGLPGDTLAMRDGMLIRNGVALAEPYVVAFGPGSRSGVGGIPLAEQLPREDRRGRRRVPSVAKQLGSVGRP